MGRSSRTFRIFVSSTFSDLKVERNALQERVFPRLRELAESHGSQFQAIDLRWGVSEEAGLDQQTMKICLEEIGHSQKVSPRPNFIVLLGDRYGWRPLPAEIPVDEFEQLLAGMDQANDRQLVETWYQVDANAVPPQAVLLSRHPQIPPGMDSGQRRAALLAEARSWAVTEKRLRSLFIETGKRLGFSQARMSRFTLSATEQEIIHGALQVSDARDHVFCFFRSIEGLPQDESASGYLDLETDPGGQVVQDRESTRSMLDLKEKLKQALPDNIHSYTASWQFGSASMDHLDQLCQDVYDRLSGVIEKAMNQPPLDELDVEIGAHRAFQAEVSHSFTGRESEQKRIREYLKFHPPHPEPQSFRNPYGTVRSSPALYTRRYLPTRTGIPPVPKPALIPGSATARESKPLAVLGAPGSGKSALLAWATDLAEKETGTSVMVRFLGVTPEASDGISLLKSMCRQLYRQFDFEKQKKSRLGDTTASGGVRGYARIEIEREFTIPEDIEGLTLTFIRFLYKIPKEKNMVLVIDGLDQLPEGDPARQLRWIPRRLPERIRVLVSASGNDLREVLRRKISDDQCMPLPEMSLQEAEALLARWLVEAQRTLQEGQLNYLLEHYKQVGLPLFLKLAFEEARQWRSWEPGNNLGDSIPGLVRSFLSRLSRDSNHGEILVRHSLGYLAASKNGLSESELLGVLSRDGEVMDDFHRRSPESPVTTSLPFVIWSRLYFDLESMFSTRREDNTLLLNFSNRIIREVVRDGFLSGESGVSYHHALSDYFLVQDDGSNLHRLAELPYQLTLAGLAGDLAAHVLLNYPFLEAKVNNGRVLSLKEDFRRALERPALFAEDDPNRRAVDLVYKVFQKVSFMLSGSPSQLRKELYGALLNSGLPAIQVLRQQIEAQSSGIWLQPVIPFPLHSGGVLLNSLEGHEKSVSHIVIFSGGDYAVSGSLDGSIRIWDLRSGIEVQSWKGVGTAIDFAYEPARELIAAVFEFGSVALYDIVSGERNFFASLQKPAIEAAEVKFINDGKTIVVVSKKGQCRLVEADTGKEVPAPAEGVPRGDRLVSISAPMNPGEIKIWTYPQGQLLADVHFQTNIYSHFITPDERRALLVFWNYSFQGWDLQAGVKLCDLEGKLHNMPHAGCISDDGKRAGASDGHLMKVWNLETGRELWSCELPMQGLHSLIKLSPDGRFVVHSIKEGCMIWDMEKSSRSLYLAGIIQDVFKFSFLPGSHTMVTASMDASIKVWDLDRLSDLDQPNSGGANSQVESLWFTPKNSHLIASCRTFSPQEGTTYFLRTWEGSTWKEDFSQGGWGKSVRFACPDERVLLATSHFGLESWDLKTGVNLETIRIFKDGSLDKLRLCAASPREQWQFRQITGGCYFTGVDPTGRWVVFLLPDGRLKFLDRQTGRETTPQERHVIGANRVLFVPGSQHMVSLSTGLMLWDLERGERMFQLLNEEGTYFEHEQVSRDGRWLVVWQGKRLRAFDLQNGQEVRDPGGLDLRLFENDPMKIEQESILNYLKLFSRFSTRKDTYLASLDGRLAVMLTWRQFQLWDLQTGVLIDSRVTKEECKQAAFSNDGQFLAVGDDPRKMTLFWVGGGGVREVPTGLLPLTEAQAKRKETIQALLPGLVQRKDSKTAIPLLNEMEQLCRDGNDDRQLEYVYACLGYFASDSGDSDTALVRYQQQEAILLRLDDLDALKTCRDNQKILLEFLSPQEEELSKLESLERSADDMRELRRSQNEIHKRKEEERRLLQELRRTSQEGDEVLPSEEK